MQHVSTLRAELACPGCRSVGLQVVTFLVEASSTVVHRAGAACALPDGSYTGRVASCEACWVRRADDLQQRRRLSGPRSDESEDPEMAEAGEAAQVRVHHGLLEVLVEVLA